MSWKIIGKGRCGWHAEADGCSSSGGTLERYLPEAEEGALVYDASGAGDGFEDLVVHGPLPKTSLAPGQVKRFNTPESHSAAGLMLAGLSGGFGTLLAQGITKRWKGYSSLDEVATDVYLGLLREVEGVRIGRVEGGKVVWEGQMDLL